MSEDKNSRCRRAASAARRPEKQKMRKDVRDAAERAAGVKKKRIEGKAIACIALVFLLAALIVVDLFAFPLRLVWVYAYMPDLPARREGEMRVHFVDVGQGDCTIVEFPGGETLMIDGGDGSAAAQRAVLGWSAALGIESYDSILLTHPDSDHAGGLEEVITLFGAETVFLPQFLQNSTAAEKFAAAAERAGAKMRTSRIYEYILSGSEESYAYMLFLAPMYLQEQGGSSNDSSAVVYLEYAGRRMLLTGDASAEVEEKLILDYFVTEGEVFRFEAEAEWGAVSLAPRLEELDFLKMGHHGSSGSTGKALAALCRPREAFASCGTGNGYGHPNLAGISNILAARPDANIWRTDELGSITLTVSADGEYTVSYTGK